MDDVRFDAFTRQFTAPRSRRRVIAGLLGGVALARSVGRGEAAAAVTLCHQPGTPAQRTLSVAPAAVPGHLSHGDYANPAGCCPGGSDVCLDSTTGAGVCCDPAAGACTTTGTCCPTSEICNTTKDGPVCCPRDGFACGPDYYPPYPIVCRCSGGTCPIPPPIGTHRQA
jgi:hypothetical protein